jgi:signal transduction histidine kinase
VKFSVMDTGKGMSKAMLESLVKNSGPVGANYAAEIDGAGLGLPISRNL